MYDAQNEKKKKKTEENTAQKTLVFNSGRNLQLINRTNASQYHLSLSTLYYNDYSVLND